MSESNRPNSKEQKFISAIETGDMEIFKQLVKRSGKSWRKIKINGHTLLQEIIHRQKCEMFLFLLEFCNDRYLEMVDDNRRTAIMQAIRNYDEYAYDFASDLAKKYKKLPNHYHVILLRWSIAKGVFQTLEYLLKKGIDPDAKNKEDLSCALNQAARKLYSDRDSHGCHEYVMMLLFYGADPFFKYQTIYSFEGSVLFEQCCEAQELLFDYTFDKLQEYEINFKVLLKLAKRKSVLFHRILEYDIEFVVEYFPMRLDAGHVELLFDIEEEYLKIVLEKCYSAVCDSLNHRPSLMSFWAQAIYHKQDRSILKKLNVFLEKQQPITDVIVDYIASIQNSYFFECVSKYEESFATKMTSFMSIYGLQITADAFNLVYEKFGYGELFKFLLYMDYEEDPDVNDIIIVSLIRDIHTDLDSVCRQQPRFYSREKLLTVLDFFAHQKLTRFLLEKIRVQNFELLDHDLQRLKSHPQIPSLQELGRNAFRKHLIQRYQVKSTKHFYWLVGQLGISLAFRKIISLETGIYR